MTSPIRWRASVNHYRASELIALRFGSTNDFIAALKIRSQNPECAYEIVDDCVFVVPKDALPLFTGIPFTEEGVISASDLPADELNELRREQGGFG